MMKALLLSLSLAQPMASEPKICAPIHNVQTAQTLSCCTESTGRQCCSKSTDPDTGKPLGCNC